MMKYTMYSVLKATVKKNILMRQDAGYQSYKLFQTRQTLPYT